MNIKISEYILLCRQKRKKNLGHCPYGSMCEENVKKSFNPDLHWQNFSFSLVRDFEGEKKGG